MKKHLILAAMATVTLFTACSNEEEESLLQGEKQVTFTIAGVDTRSQTTVEQDGSISTAFVAGDQIGIAAVATTATLGTDIVGYQVAQDGSGVTPISGSGLTYKKDGAATFYAHYPYQSGATTSSVSFTVPANQSSEETFNAADFMIAKNEVTTLENNIELEFNHGLVLVQMVWNSEEEVTGVTLHGAYKQVTWDGTTVTTTTTGENATQDITMWETADNKFWALIPAATIASSTKLFTISTADATYNYTTGSEIVLSAGNAISFALSTNSVVAGITVRANGWTNIVEQNGGSLEEVEEPETPAIELINQVTFEEVDLQSITASSISTTDVEENIWYSWIPTANNANTIEIDGSTMKINKAADALSWNNRLAIYRVDGDLISQSSTKIFTLKVTGTSSVDSRQLRLGAVRITKSGNFFPMFKGIGYKTFSTTSSEQSLDIDFNQISTDNGSNYTTASTSDYDDVIIILAPNKYQDEAITFTINSVTLVEKEVTE